MIINILKTVPVLFVLCLLPQGILAQAKVYGRVVSGGKPVETAQVMLANTAYSAFTDSSGKFTLGPCAAGQYRLQVISINFKPYQQDIWVDSTPVRLTVNLEASDRSLDELVVSGTMKETYLKESPIAVQVLTPQLFRRNPSPVLFEALQMVNGVRPQINCNVCNTGDIHINGMEGPYTMILIDGMPIVSSLSTVYGLNGIPNSLVERIEVVKGPASTLYGSEAVAGLVNIITKNPATGPTATVESMVTSLGEYSLDLGARYTKRRLSSLLSASYFTFNNRLDINHDGFTDVPLQNRISLFNKWNLQLPHGEKAQWAVRYLYEDRFGGQMQWNNYFRGSDSLYGESIYTSRWEAIGQAPVHIAGQKINFSVSYNYHHQNSYYGMMPFMATQQVGFAQALWNPRVGHKHDLLTGLTLRYTWYDDNTPATATADPVNPRTRPSKVLLPGIFLQDEWSWNEHVKLLTGARLDHHPEHGFIFSPRANLKWSPNSSNTFRLGAGNGYRVVNLFTEDHAALTGSREVVIKSALKPEQSYNVNLHYTGFVNMRSGFIGVEASVFYTYFTNQITGDFLTDPNKIIYDNLHGHAISQGISLDFNGQLFAPLRWSVGGTFMEVYRMLDQGTGGLAYTPMLHAPKVSGTFGLTYTWKKAGLTFDYTGNYTGPMHLPVQPNDYRPDMSPWFALQHIQVTRRWNDWFSVFAGVKNVFNFIPADPLMRPFDPFDKYVQVNNPNGYTFDTSYNYAEMKGRRYFIGIRYNR